VGTQSQLDFLAKRGCHAFQGYLVSKPLPAAAFAEFCRQRVRARPVSAPAD
jgi:EAL domain-containing protein (putative c-di-GMP-specific phosphodiesterase class I)